MVKDIMKNDREWRFYTDSFELEEARYLEIRDRDLSESDERPPIALYSDDSIPNCAYFNCPISFQTDPMEKHKILIDYNGDRDFLSDYIFKNYPDKLRSVLDKPENKKYELKTTDFKRNKFKAKSGYCRDKMTKIVLDNFKEELMAIGVTNDQIIAARNGGRRRAFLMRTAMEHAHELRAVGMDKEQIKYMEEFGRVPEGFNVHHKFNRFYCAQIGIDYNNPANLILIKRNPHDKLHAIENVKNGYDQDGIKAYNQQIKEGGAYITKIWPVGCVYNENRQMTETEIIEQTIAEMKQVFKPRNKKEKEWLDATIATIRADEKIQNSGINAFFDKKGKDIKDIYTIKSDLTIKSDTLRVKDSSLAKINIPSNLINLKNKQR